MPYIQLQFRRDTQINWQQINPVLASGEMGIELDTHMFKIGDGSCRWNDLPYGGLQGPPGPAGGAPLTGGIDGQVLTCTGPNPGNVAWRSPNSTNAIIRASTGTNYYNFSNLDNIYISPSFGSSFLATSSVSSNPSDTTGFTIVLNSKYNMLNIPIMVGTIVYWDGTNMNYMQVKFGNSITTYAVRSRIHPASTNYLLRDIHGNPLYGSPLSLSVDGISSNAFTGATNISTTPPLNYAIAVFLEILN